MIDQYINRARPAAEAAAAEARAWMNEVICELRLLRAAVSDDDNTVILRHTPFFTNLPGGEAPAIDTAPQHELPIVNNTSGIVPPGEIWELEVISARGGVAAGTLVIYRNNYRVMTVAAGLGSMNPVSGNGLRFQGGDVINYGFAAGVATTFEAYMQFRVAKPAPARPVNSARQWENPTPTRLNDDSDAAGLTLPRHAGTYFQGDNVVGEARARINGTN